MIEFIIMCVAGVAVFVLAWTILAQIFNIGD
jgi:hypothetical protein